MFIEKHCWVYLLAVILFWSCDDTRINAPENTPRPDPNISITVNIGEVDSSQGLAKRTNREKPGWPTVLCTTLTPNRPFLGKSSRINGTVDTIKLAKLFLRLEEESGQEIISDTIDVHGLVNESITSAYLDSIPPRMWRLNLRSENDIGDTIHDGAGALKTKTGDGVNVTINLIVVTMHTTDIVAGGY